jgi:hypothetical protein
LVNPAFFWIMYKSWIFKANSYVIRDRTVYLKA